MVYDITWRAWHGIWYVLADMAWHMVMSCEVWHDMYMV